MNKILDNIVVEEAKNADVIEFLSRYYGYTFKECGGFRAKEHPSLAVARDRHGWAWHSQNLYGYGAISFLMKVENMTFVQAVEEIIGYSVSQVPVFLPPEPPKVLQLPQKDEKCHKIWHYLCTVRCLDPSIVKNLIDCGLIYQDVRGNVVFIGRNEERIPKFACVRGTYPEKPYRKDCFWSDKAYSFHMTAGAPTRLYALESPIDCISHGSLENLMAQNSEACFADGRLSLGGVSGKALGRYLKQYQSVKEIVFCLDNDEAGRESAVKLAREYENKGYFTRVELPVLKDYNEVLVAELKQRNQAVNTEKNPEKVG